MRILVVAKFLHQDGGTETYLQWQVNALVGAGHDVGLVGMRPPPSKVAIRVPAVQRWLTPTRAFKPGQRGRLRSAATSVYSLSCRRVMEQALREFEPDVVHFHGTCYHLTSSVVDAAAHAELPILMTAHEYKLICANQLLFDDRKGQICTDCLGTSASTKLIAPVRRACMKSSRAVSVLGALEGQVSLRSWRRASPTILTPSQFMRTLLLQDGWPPDRVHHLDLPWPDGTSVRRAGRASVVYVGRLVAGKGLEVLLESWAMIAGQHPAVDLRIIGDGEQRGELERHSTTHQIPRVRFLGRLAHDAVREQLDTALVTAQPAQWYENSPLSVRESLMAGVPAIVSDRGGMPELVGPDSGYVVPDDRPQSWAQAMTTALVEGRADSEALRADVAARKTSAADHLHALVGAYLAADH